MRGIAQPDGRPVVEWIETQVLLFSSCGPKYAKTTHADVSVLMGMLEFAMPLSD